MGGKGNKAIKLNDMEKKAPAKPKKSQKKTEWAPEDVESKSFDAFFEKQMRARMKEENAKK
jgi:hypothetical protein